MVDPHGATLSDAEVEAIRARRDQLNATFPLDYLQPDYPQIRSDADMFTRLLAEVSRQRAEIERLQTALIGTIYCGRPLVGGWCKRAPGHEDGCACS